ncbi:repressor LexA [Paenibacillus sp. 4624]|uniref:LexA family protein n=1 Tax=Paenibacillus sp. 4624 TaxID=3156453 RepID=UPI003D229514
MTKKSIADKPLSPRQQEVYDFIADFIDSHGYGPSIREIADAFMFVTSTAFKHVETLINKGYLNHKAGGVRTLSLTDKSSKKIAMVSQAGVMNWIEQQSNQHAKDATIYVLLTDLQEGIQTGRIC